jgi:TRAP-type uncharacterized transport system fused permease subunit
MLAAAGIGAILSPPTLGAAAFIIAEYLGVPYLTVLVWAIAPTILYYLGILLAVEIDARRWNTREVEISEQSGWRLLGRFGYHLISLVMIVVFLAMDISALRAVVYASFVQIALSFLDKERRMTPARLYRSLGTGVRACWRWRGVRRGGRHRGDDHQDRAGPAAELDPGQRCAGHQPKTRLLSWFSRRCFAALAVAVLGLAVPVTASFVISWVIVGPACRTSACRARGGHVRLLLQRCCRR